MSDNSQNENIIDSENLIDFIDKAEDFLLTRARLSRDADALFEKNMEAFSKYYPNLHAQLLELAKEKKSKRIFLNVNNQFNIIPEGAEIPLYGEDPIEDCIKQVSQEVTNPKFNSMTLNSSPTDEGDQRVHVRFLVNLIKLSKKSELKNSEILGKLPEHYPSFMLFGVGLGYQLNLINSEYSFDYYFLCEPDLNLFLNSLYVFNWSEFLIQKEQSNSFVFLQVGVSYHQFIDEMVRLSQSHGPHYFASVFIFQHYPSQDINCIIKTFFENSYKIHSGFGFYNDAITGLAHFYHSAKSGVRYLKSTDSHFQRVYTPVFIVGNGPSLDDSINYIKQNADKALIFAAGTALQTLIKYGIRPDFHVLVERTKATYDVLIDTVELEYLKSTSLLTVELMYPKVLRLYGWSAIGLKGPEMASDFANYLSYYCGFPRIQALKFSGPVVSNTALSYALHMGFKEIFMFGVDNGSYSDKTHSENSIYEAKKSRFKTYKVQSANNLLEGNFGEVVNSTNLLAVSNLSMELLLKSFKSKNVSVYKVGRGAKVSNAIPTRLSDLLPLKDIDKNKIVLSIKENFFPAYPEQDILAYFNFDSFDIVADELISMFDSIFSSRKEFCQKINEANILLSSVATSPHCYVSKVFTGTFFYFCYAAYSSIYKYDDPELGLKLANESSKLWCGFLKEIKISFREDVKKLCDFGYEFGS